ncbi:Rv0361 family membrane protein [Micromonospora sagamiensis]|uniref:Uncharacterized protein DUF4878 n=1 Tax=Micromonospora sagamiensis TaxID=47875 RepID=A0A562WBP1_9ACTN|nr:DUF4878 domain-containing protein [Micromonospora sagamiensis]TWJ27044.1 uncharacterized protein DUF4878 [Micromonospora sagamiensis]
MDYQLYAAPPARPRRTGRTIAIIVAVVFLLCCVGGSVGGFLLYRTVSDAVAPVQDTTRTYLDAVRRGDNQTAYAQLCSSTRGRMSEQEFTQLAATQPKLVNYDIDGVVVNNVNGRTTGTATVRLSYDGGIQRTQVFTLVKEDGAFRVCE